MMLGSKIKPITNVSMEGTDQLWYIWQPDGTEFRCQGPTAHKGDTVDSDCTANKFTGTCATVEIQTRTINSSEERRCE